MCGRCRADLRDLDGFPGERGEGESFGEVSHSAKVQWLVVISSHLRVHCKYCAESQSIVGKGLSDHVH